MPGILDPRSYALWRSAERHSGGNVDGYTDLTELQTDRHTEKYTDGKPNRCTEKDSINKIITYI